MIVWSFILLGSLAWLGAAHPIHSDAEPQWMLRERRSPLAARSQANGGGGGYHYERPERAFHPHAALATRKQDLVDEDPEAAQPDREHKSVEEAPVVPERKPKAVRASKPKAPKRRPTADEDEEEDDEDRGSVYRDFFPMTFAGDSMSRTRNAEEGEGEGGRGPVTAIANSFSKGRGAIASSSAVAHGNPDAAQSRRRQQNKNRAQE